MSRIAEINDDFRKSMLNGLPTNGRYSMTQGVASLDADTQMRILAKVAAYNIFDPEDDPYAEHDFGVIEMQGVPRIYWKIDYYEDASLQYGAEDKVTAYRSLLILLADEY